MGLRRQRASDNAAMSATDMSMSKYLRSGIDASIYEPQWEKGLPTAVKILPEWDKENKRFCMYRESLTDDDKGLGNFRMVLPIIKWAGSGDNKTKLSCILYDPAAVRDDEYDRSSNPYIAMRDAIKALAYNGQKIKAFGKRIDTGVWLKYFTGKREDKILSNPQMAAFMQVVMYTARGKTSLDKESGLPMGLGDNDKPIILLVSEAANKELSRLLSETKETFDPTATIRKPADFAKHYRYGDITNIAGGRFTVLVNPSEDAMQSFESVTKNEKDDAKWMPDKIGDFKSYAVGLVPQLKIRHREERKTLSFTPDLSAHESAIRSRMLDWFADDVFRLMSHDELCEAIAEAYKPTPELLEVGWESYPEYYKLDAVQAKIKSRTQGFVPGAADTDDPDDYDDDENIGSASSDDDDDEGSSSRSRRRGRLRDTDDDDDDDEDAKPKKRSKREEAASVYDNVDSEYDDDEEDKKPTRSTRKKKTSSAPPAKSSKRVAKKSTTTPKSSGAKKKKRRPQ